MMRCIYLLIACFGFAGPVWGDGYALIVGVNDCPKFRLADGSRPRALRAAESDADAMAEVLKRDFGLDAKKVRLLKGPEATYEKVKTAFADLIKQLRPEDVFVFYFAGHGTQIGDREPFDEPDGLDEALCPHDVTEKGDNLIVDDELGVWLEAIPARQITVILDCCHADTGTKDLGDDVAVRFLPIPIEKRRPEKAKEPWRELRDNTKGSDRLVTAFFACRAEQRAYERLLPGSKPGVRAGQFTHYFLEALKQAENAATNQSVWKYAAARLEDAFNRTQEKAADRQEPILQSDRPGDFVFGLRRKKSADRRPEE